AQYSRVEGSSLATLWGENAGSNMRRASAWKGGSDEMGGAIPSGASSIGGRWLLTMMLRDVKCSVSFAIALTSAWRVGSHTPPYRSEWATGQRCRRSSQIGYGSATQASSVWSKSVAQSTTGRFPMRHALRTYRCATSLRRNEPPRAQRHTS